MGKLIDAIGNGATRPVYYESRVIKLKLDEAALQLIDAEYDLMDNVKAKKVELDFWTDKRKL